MKHNENIAYKRIVLPVILGCPDLRWLAQAVTMATEALKPERHQIINIYAG